MRHHDDSINSGPDVGRRLNSKRGSWYFCEAESEESCRFPSHQMKEIEKLAEALDEGEDQLDLWQGICAEIPAVRAAFADLAWAREVTGAFSFRSALSEIGEARDSREGVLVGDCHSAAVRFLVSASLVHEASGSRAAHPVLTLDLCVKAISILDSLSGLDSLLKGPWADPRLENFLPCRYHAPLRWTRAKALALAGNSCRLRGDLRAAGEYFARARSAEIPEGTPRRVLGEIASLEASLRLDAGNRGQAEALLVEAEEHFRSIDERDSLAATKIKIAQCRYESGEPSAAALAVEGVFELAPKSSHLGQLALLNLALYRLDGEDFTEARRIALEVSPFKESVFELRRQWLQARLCNTGTETASRRFEAVTLGFQLAGLPLDAALAAMDWALLLLSHGRALQAQEVSAAIYGLFAAEGLPSEATAALQIFAAACRDSCLDEALVRSLSKKMRRRD